MNAENQDPTEKSPTMFRTILTVAALTITLCACEPPPIDPDTFVPRPTAPGILDDPTGPGEYDFTEGDLAFRCDVYGTVTRVVPDLGGNRELAEEICRRRIPALRDDSANSGYVGP